MKKTIIIAEIGECFNGDLKRAEQLIFMAKDCGCDIAKFQTLDYENIPEDDPEKEWFRKIALSPDKIKFLIESARNVGISILFTPENIKTGQWLLDAGLSSVKIASSSITDLEFLRFIKESFSQVFVSTGMASLEEIKCAVECLQEVADLFIMHCVSEYPTGPLLEKRGLRALAHADVRLDMMLVLMDSFPRHKIGYSDHTAGILAPIAAVAAGARAIEKHITKDRDKFVKGFGKSGGYCGTDHVLSLEQDELREMVLQIREVDKMFSQGKWERSEGEKILNEFLRKRFSGEKA